MGIARQLYELQEIDLELESSERALAQVISQIGESQAAAAVRQELAEAETRLDELKQRQQSAEWEIDDYTAKLAAIEEKLYSGRINNPKELTSLQQEGEVLKKQRSRVEDGALELMEQVAQAESRVVSLEGKLKEMEGRWRSEQAQLKLDEGQYRAQVAELKEKRQRFAAGIDPAAVGVYDSIRKYKGWAVAKVEKGTCRSCGITLSTAQLQQARGEQLLRCSNCGRVLFHP